MSRISFRKTCLALGGALMLTAHPALAQDETANTEDNGSVETMEQGFAGLGELFKAEPLTAEQEARLPLARTIVAKIVPEGAMRDMIDGMMGGMFGEIMKAGAEPQPAANFVASQLGISAGELELDEAQLSELADMFDPARDIRKAKEAEIFPAMMGEMMSSMEPVVRKSMAELYAIHFSQAELTDIDAFFSTPSGANYARKSFSMASDPRIAAGTMEALPDMMQQFATMEQKMALATADLPAKRSFSELSENERARIATLTGYAVDDLDAWAVPSAAAMEAAVDAAAEAAEAAAGAAEPVAKSDAKAIE